MEFNHQWLEANKDIPCPLCNRDHYCYLYQLGTGKIVTAICHWAEIPELPWLRTGTAKDGRGIFTDTTYRYHRRTIYPAVLDLACCPNPDDSPQWLDYVLDLCGDKIHLGKHGKQQEQAIEYLYPTLTGEPLGRIIRKQWTDRRRVYDGNRKTKEIRPWHWAPTQFGGHWSDRGKGDKPWPLYREAEAVEAILAGKGVFLVGGEQCVEYYRQLGYVATSPQGGEANWQAIVERLFDSAHTARRNGLRPLLVIHPDNDLTGQGKYANELLSRCLKDGLLAVALEPLSLWPQMPPGGDICDVVHHSGMTTEEIRERLELVTVAAIDQAELDIEAQLQRKRWHAPDSHKGELGYWRRNVDKDDEAAGFYFEPKTDFDFIVERELSSDSGGGLVLLVTRADRGSQQRVFLESADYTNAQKFEDAMKRGLKDAIVCNLTTPQVKALVRVRLQEYHINRKGKTYRLADRVGQQTDGTWVFKDRQLTINGQPTSEERSLWIYSPNLTGEEATMPAPKIADPDPNALGNLIRCLQSCMGSNFPQAMLCLGYVAAGVHYQQIMDVEGAFPTLNAYGDAGCGKSTAAESALSLVGNHRDGMMVSLTLSAAYEKLRLCGGITQCLDDPKRTPELNEFLKGFYNGRARVVRGKEVSFAIQKPHSTMMVTSNHACGENDAPTKSRLIRLFFPKLEGNDDSAFALLPGLQDRASGCFPDLIRLGYPLGKIRDMEQRLAALLPNAHSRISKSLALVVVYAQLVAELGGVEVNLMDYVRNTLCLALNDPEESGDSLRDFLQKVFALQSESKVGEWNMRWLEHPQQGKELCIHLPSVWQVVDAVYKPAYNRRVIEGLMENRGANKLGRARFYESEDDCKTYKRAVIAGNAVNAPEKITRACWQLPESLIRSYSDMYFQVTEVTHTSEDHESQTELNFQALPEKVTPSDPQNPETLTPHTLHTVTFKSNVEKREERRVAQGQEEKPALPVTFGVTCLGNAQELDGAEILPCDLPALLPLPGNTHISISDQSSCDTNHIKTGAVVVIDAAATWLAKGSDSLPPEAVKEYLRRRRKIPLELLAQNLSFELQGRSTVISVSECANFIKVRQIATGRISVFESQFVHVMEGNANG